MKPLSYFLGKVALSVLISLFLGGNFASARTVLYEGFDYPAGDVDGSQAGGTGFVEDGWTTSASNTGLSNITVGTGTFSFVHPLADPPLDNFSATYEWSLDLSSWNAAGDTVNGTTVNIGAAPSTGTTTVNATVSGTVPDKIFVRIDVIQQ